MRQVQIYFAAGIIMIIVMILMLVAGFQNAKTQSDCKDQPPQITVEHGVTYVTDQAPCMDRVIHCPSSHDACKTEEVTQ